MWRAGGVANVGAVQVMWEGVMWNMDVAGGVQGGVPVGSAGPCDGRGDETSAQGIYNELAGILRRVHRRVHRLQTCGNPPTHHQCIKPTRPHTASCTYRYQPASQPR